MSSRQSKPALVYDHAAHRRQRRLRAPLEPLRASLLSFEMDVWGRLRRATEAARADLLASDNFRKAVITTLVSDVASAYFNRLELDLELAIAMRTLQLREESLTIIQNRERGGLGTLLEVRQGEQLVYTAAQVIPQVEQLIEQTENQLSLLLGGSPTAMARGLSLTDQEPPPAVPGGLPSALLDRRPDILVAEQNLVAANAIIGVAKAAYFPRISLTGFLGVQSDALSNLFSGPGRIWQFVPRVTQPIFNAGRLRSNFQTRHGPTGACADRISTRDPNGIRRSFGFAHSISKGA